MRAKMLVLVPGVLGLLTLAKVADARDDRLRLPIADVLNSADAKAKLDPGVALYFGKQPYAPPAQRMTTERRTRRPTSSTRPIRKAATGCSCRR